MIEKSPTEENVLVSDRVPILLEKLYEEEKDLEIADIKKLLTKGSKEFGLSLDGATLKDSKLTNTVLNKVTCDMVDLEGSKINASFIIDSSFKYSNLKNINLTNTKAITSDFFKGNFTGGNFEVAEFVKCNFTGATFQKIYMLQTLFCGSTLDGADFVNIEARSLIEANFYNCSMKGSRFTIDQVNLIKHRLSKKQLGEIKLV